VGQKLEQAVGKGIDKVGGKVLSNNLFKGLFIKMRFSRFGQAFERRMYRLYERRLLGEVKSQPVPQHIAIIMDGNRRFAKKLGIETVEGHKMGRDKLEDVVDWCLEAGVKILTVYAFSTENFKRGDKEVSTLMHMFAENFRKMADDPRVHKNKIHVSAIGRLEMLPDDVQEAIKYAKEKTKDYSDYYYNVAVAYGGRAEIVDAIKRIAKDVKNGKLDAEKIDENTVSERLYTGGLPDPDLVLRTSGEERISNFLLWQMAYSELSFVDVYWPEFSKRDFLRAIKTFQKRQRRVGK
jgi:tritrans,polycis-undecaprenyl-diphosphate synthase [geranylgeranyl-diphosphate specific]